MKKDYKVYLIDILAAIAVEQLKRLDALTKKRQQIANIYNNAFKNVRGLITPYTAPDRSHVYHQYTLRITKDFPMTRDKLQKYLEKKGIQSVIYYPKPLYRFDHLPYSTRPKEFPVTEKITKEVLSIPVHPLLKQTEIEYIIETIKNCSGVIHDAKI